MRANRLLSLLLRLQLHGRETAQSLADTFEVSVRTIYRDLDELSAAGVPVTADRGPGGGIRLLEGYRTRLTGLTSREAETLLLAGLPGPAAELGLDAPLAAARLKLLAAMSPAAGRAAERVGLRFHLDPRDWYRRAPSTPHLKALAEALWTERRILLRYASGKETVERTLDPLGLVLKAGAWYLVARNGAAIRTYAVTRIQELRTLEEGFAYPARFDLARHWEAERERFEASLQRGEALVRVAPGALTTLSRLGSAAEDRILAAAPDARGRREATIPIESVAHAAAQLLGFADDVEVLAPAELRREIRKRARRTARMYASARLSE